MKQLDPFGFEIEEADSKELQKQRLSEYDKPHCFQFDIRQRNYEEDLFYSGMTREEAESLRVSDFRFSIAENDSQKKSAFSLLRGMSGLGR